MKNNTTKQDKKTVELTLYVQIIQESRIRPPANISHDDFQKGILVTALYSSYCY